MAVGLWISFAGGTQEQYDAVNAEMGVEQNPPEGLVFHSAGPIEGGWNVIDFWESREPSTASSRSRLGPAIGALGDKAPPEPARASRSSPSTTPSRADGAERREMGLNLASLLTESAERTPDAPAIRLGELELSYGELDDRSARLATLLREKGLEPGDRVGVMLPNVPEFPVAYYGVLRAGGVVVPMNVLLKRREIAFYLEDSGAKLLLAWHGFPRRRATGAADAGAELIEVEPASFAATPRRAGADPGPGRDRRGRHRGDPLHLGHDRQAEGRRADPPEPLPQRRRLQPHHLRDRPRATSSSAPCPSSTPSGRRSSMNASLKVGACLTLVPRFDPGEALATMQRDGVTHFYGVPTMYGALLHHPERESFDTSSLRICITGGASMPVEVLRGFEDAFGAKVMEGYGLSETSPVACSNHPDTERKAGSIGTPIEGVEMQVVDEDDNPVAQGEVGEIVIRGHNIMKGYWQRPDATEEAMRGGWFHSGDMARTDEDGYFYIVDRKKDLIIRGGYNVYPREVEEVLYEHPKIREAAVVGVPHDEWGEEIGAAVVLHEGEELPPEEVSAYVKERIAAYKYPRVVWFLDELPKGPTGKILKREIEPPARCVTKSPWLKLAGQPVWR